jgi:uncharacterized damage-inducible protein DinB
MTTTPEVRELLARQLDWHEAHVGFDRAVADFPLSLQGEVPVGFSHSGWQLLEHMRRAQADILDFCVNSDYVYPTSMAGLWPLPSPESSGSWDGAVAAFVDDIAALKRLTLDETAELFEPAPCARSERQTLARALILVTDHNAYHLGQLVTLRKVLGCWVEGPGWG